MTCPIFIISLADATDRRRRITARLQSLGLKGTFIDAVDGRNGLAPEYASRLDRDAARAFYHRNLTDAEFACALSHRLVYEKIIADGHERAVVLEDDAVPQPELKAFLDHTTNELPDLILFDYGNALFHPLRRSNMVSGFRLRRLLNVPFRTTGYAVTNGAAGRILRARPKVDRMADWPVDIRKLKAAAIVPRLVIPDPESASAIEEGRLLEIKSGKGRWRIRGAPTKGEI